MMKRAKITGIVLLSIILVVFAVVHFTSRGRPYVSPPLTFQGESKDLHQSVIVPTLDTPMPQGRNVVWCGTVELGWKHLEKDVLHGPPEIPSAEPVVSRLNSGIIAGK